MRRLLLVLVGSVGVIGILAPHASTQANRLAGTWKLVGVERLGPKGDILPAPAAPAFGSPNPVGVLMYDPNGYMGVTIMQSGRQKYTGVEPTPDEAKAALASYVSYFGTFSVDETGGIVTHHVHGSLNPSMEPEQRRSYQITGNRLTLNTSRSSTGTQAQLIWERVPDLAQLTPEHRRFIGFWKPVTTERRTGDGKVLPPEPRPARVGFLIYTTAGYMAVHLMDPGRPKYKGAQPTPEEAQMALRTYGSAYFGPYTIHQTEGYVVHHQLGMINPGGGVGTDTIRGYRFEGDNRLVLMPPKQTVNGQTVQSFVTWERVTPRITASE
jgi:hypothetical protein